MAKVIYCLHLAAFGCEQCKAIVALERKNAVADERERYRAAVRKILKYTAPSMVSSVKWTLDQIAKEMDRHKG